MEYAIKIKNRPPSGNCFHQHLADRCTSYFSDELTTEILCSKYPEITDIIAVALFLLHVHARLISILFLPKGSPKQ